MTEIIVHTQKELDAAVKEKGCYIVIKDTTEWLSVSGNATIQSVYDNATIQSVSDNATIQSVSDNATIRSVYGNATIRYVYGNATIQYVSGNATIRVFSDAATIEAALMFAVIIMVGCVCKIMKRAKTASVIKNKIATYTKANFLQLYEPDKKGNVTLYKSVNPETGCDFYSGEIKYEGTVTCPDWDGDKKRQCGGGLHLSPLPEMALKYNEGKILKCKVHKNNFVVYPNDISKVRCKEVTVIGEEVP